MRAFGGAGQAWGKLARTGGVHMDDERSPENELLEGPARIEEPELS
jgi:hypothetical protein